MSDSIHLHEIATRGVDIGRRAGVPMDFQQIISDLKTVNQSVRMDFQALCAASDFNLIHDVFGIHNNLNRETGQLENEFFPRFRLKAGAK